ncbi:hypothetical protein TI39_contig289g00016 [Zymoseptoria brevis]|uniref:Uncharacterized protein n=1 Tax=Zymoseptoria brevis TaxID=1047168 RepID=A0A0F4GVV3_9PEZI|nr:hypothetical protein TI39_contig289g00016 [Zymoseptoria brevis]
MLSNYLTLLAGAAAFTNAISVSHIKNNYFNVTDCTFGCTSGCYYAFNVTIVGSQKNHPAVDIITECRGNTTVTSYIDCTFVSETQSIGAYIDKDNQLQLAYYVNAMDGDFYSYFGNTTIYSETGTQAELAKRDFCVPENRATV